MSTNKNKSNQLDGKSLSEQRRHDLKQKINNVTRHNGKPQLAVIQVGENPASSIYVQHKKQACIELGMIFDWIRAPEDASMDELESIIDKLNRNKAVHGILLQLPLPKHIHANTLLSKIAPEKDVDGLHPNSLGKKTMHEPTFTTCVAKGLIDLLEGNNLNIEGKHAVVVGASSSVGQPIATALLEKKATVTICHDATESLKKHTQQADVLVAAIGKQNIITADHIKPGAIVIDVGIHRMPDQTIAGDIPFEAASKIAGWITPVPGGIGPMTVAALMENMLRAYTQQVHHDTT